MKPIAYRIGVAGGYVHSTCWTSFETAELIRKNRRPAMGALLGHGAGELVGQECVWCGNPFYKTMKMLKTVSPTGIDSYFKHSVENVGGGRTTILTGFRSARVFESDEELEAAKALWRESLDDEAAAALELVVVDVNAMPMPPDFAEAFPIDASHIPESGKEVELIYRDGSRVGVVTNYLFAQLKRDESLNVDSRYARWRYLEKVTPPPKVVAEPEDERKHVTEDILGEFGFRVVWSVLPHWANVVVYEIAIRDEDGTPGFNRAGARSLPDPVYSVEEAESYLEGHVKWDGCTELNQGGPHWCGPRGYIHHCALLKYIYARANELMDRDPPEDGTWEAAEAAMQDELRQAPLPVKYPLNKFFVGTSEDPKYPGIVSGPFDEPPKLAEKHHTLWRGIGTKVVRAMDREVFV